MMQRIDNIVIGDLVDGVTLEMLGVLDDEITIHITEGDAKDINLFLPKILVSAGIFPSANQVKQLQKQRDGMKGLNDDERNLWRTLATPELTKFKVGKRLFWLIVGELTHG